MCDITDDYDNMIYIFATNDSLRNLCHSEVVLVDKTFFACPGLFTQLYSLNEIVDGIVFPFVFVFLILAPEIVIMDFETAVRNAPRAIFPMAYL